MRRFRLWRQNPAIRRFWKSAAIHDVEFHLPERRRNLVLDDFDPGLVADDFVAVLDRTDATNIQADTGIEFQRVTARGGFRDCRT